MVWLHKVTERGKDMEDNEADQFLGGHGNFRGQSIGQMQIVVRPRI